MHLRQMILKPPSELAFILIQDYFYRQNGDAKVWTLSFYWQFYLQNHLENHHSAILKWKSESITDKYKQNLFLISISVKNEILDFKRIRCYWKDIPMVLIKIQRSQIKEYASFGFRCYFYVWAKLLQVFSTKILC